MNCEACEASLIDYAYDELEPEARRAVMRHLAECAGCAVNYCRLRADLDGALQVAHESPPPAVRAALRAEVERSFRPSWWRRALVQVRRPVPVYAVLLVALVLPAAVWLTLAAVRHDAAAEASRGGGYDVAAAGAPRVRGYDAAASLQAQRRIL